MITYPIQFAFPKSKIPNLSTKKTNLFSDLSPLGRAKKYKFFIENEYYNHYSKSYFAITMKKGGWDCLRHYEILASGTIPYFLDIENCPKNTLFNWPKKLLIAAKNISGMPSEKKVIKATMKDNLDQFSMKKNEINENQYWDIHTKLMQHFSEHLTSDRLSEYFLDKLGIEKKTKALLVFGCHGTSLDYMRDSLIFSLAKSPLLSLDLYPNPYWHLENCHRQILNTLYGRGFSCTATLSESDYSTPQWNEIIKNIESYGLIIACSASNQGFSSLPAEVQEVLNKRNDIVWVDGNDVKADHEIPSCAKVSFQRELK